MTKDTSLENNGGTPSTSNSNPGNDDAKAELQTLKQQLEEERKAHDVTKQQRNMYKNQAEERETKLTEASKKLEDLQGDFDNLRSEKEKSEKAQAINAKKSELLKDYPENVRAKAEKLGIDLADAEDADAIKSFTDKLDTLKGDSPAAGDKGADGNGGDPGKPPAPPITGDNPRPDANKGAAKTDEEILAEEEARLADVKF